MLFTMTALLMRNSGAWPFSPGLRAGNPPASGLILMLVVCAPVFDSWMSINEVPCTLDFQSTASLLLAFAPGSPSAGDPRGVRLPPGPSAAAQAVAREGLTLRSDNPIDPWGEPTARFRGQKRVLGLEACGILAGPRLVLCAGQPLGPTEKKTTTGRLTRRLIRNQGAAGRTTKAQS